MNYLISILIIIFFLKNIKSIEICDSLVEYVSLEKNTNKTFVNFYDLICPFPKDFSEILKSDIEINNLGFNVLKYKNNIVINNLIYGTQFAILYTIYICIKISIAISLL